mmetsp:Transcript_7295/g.17982  ORF Transcript_7295/g.17982 Transcript_7295/m.17982 type:complete len:275 (+) Transcript_7295:37-861(+)
MSHKPANDDAMYHLAASGIAAVVNFPLWRASAIAQSGFKLEGSNMMVRYYKAVVQPPYRGVLATMLGMTWARAAIFFGSDIGKDYMKKHGYYGPLAQTVPPFLIGTFVQIANMPLVRATITIQDPSSTMNSVSEALVHIYKTKGISGLWHGVSAGIMKTVPKYITAVAVKDYMEEKLPRADPADKQSNMVRSGIKSVTAGLAGAILTNPLDVIRNEMFKTDLSLKGSFQKLVREEGAAFMTRGMTSNMTAVAFPVAMTIFVTDMLLQGKDRLAK